MEQNKPDTTTNIFGTIAIIILGILVIMPLVSTGLRAVGFVPQNTKLIKIEATKTAKSIAMKADAYKPSKGERPLQLKTNAETTTSAWLQLVNEKGDTVGVWPSPVIKTTDGDYTPGYTLLRHRNGSYSVWTRVDGMGWETSAKKASKQSDKKSDNKSDNDKKTNPDIMKRSGKNNGNA